MKTPTHSWLRYWTRGWHALAVVAVCALTGCGDEDEGASVPGISRTPPEIYRPAPGPAAAATPAAGAEETAAVEAEATAALPNASTIDVDRLLRDPGYADEVARRNPAAPTTPATRPVPAARPSAAAAGAARRPDLGMLPMDATDHGARPYREFDLEQARKDVERAQTDPETTRQFFLSVREFQAAHPDPNAAANEHVPPPRPGLTPATAPAPAAPAGAVP